MRVVAFLITCLPAIVLAAQNKNSVDIFAWPLSASQPQSFATVTYTANNATIQTYTAPHILSSDDVVRIGFHNPAGSWSGVVTASSNLDDSKDKKILLHLNPAGELYHVGFRATDLPSSSKTGKGKDVVGVEVIRTQGGPTPHLNKPVVLDAEGKIPVKEQEKSFLQKYWWVIAGFFLVQLVMGGSAKE